MLSYKRKEKFIVNLVFYCLITAILFVVCKYLLPVLMPFVLALLVTLILQPAIHAVEKRYPRLKKASAILFCALFYFLCSYFLVNFGVSLVQKAGNMIARIPALYESQIVPALWMGYEKLDTFARSIDPSLSSELDAMFRDTMQNMRLSITEYSMKGVGILTNTLTMIPGLFLKVVITIVATFFLVADFDGIIDFCKKMIPQNKRETTETTLAYVKETIKKYIASYSIILTVTFLELSIGFLLLKVPHAVFIGFLVAVFDILPILGTGGILIPWAIISWLMGNNGDAIGLILLYIVIIVVRNIIEPRIVGAQIGLHPLVTLVALFVGLKFFGLIGMIGLPLSLSVLVSLDRNDVIHLFPREGKKSALAKVAGDE